MDPMLKLLVFFVLLFLVAETAARLNCSARTTILAVVVYGIFFALFVV